MEAEEAILARYWVGRTEESVRLTVVVVLSDLDEYQTEFALSLTPREARQLAQGLALCADQLENQNR